VEPQGRQSFSEGCERGQGLNIEEFLQRTLQLNREQEVQGRNKTEKVLREV
jgi:hypothetical protein